MKIPMCLAGKMHTLVNNKAAQKVCMKDRSSAGNWATMAFLTSYMQYQPDIEPQRFTVCPILLTQPGEDRWTPLHLSELFLSKISNVPVDKVILPQAGHYPLEKAGLDVMVEAIHAFLIKQLLEN
ncbi:alpha/beta fold hydrolase [Methylophaga frappieri]|uniref:alpha/beta fold hydrolase n=1 Tax=Methylophaga frappieri (strain ATCC BAA-2434 / DSM 25690 / JAM7) TaxID=754477 RepID=UPI0002F47A05|nr:alpha/beta hydrolase [Methylophaga frappieri]